MCSASPYGMPEYLISVCVCVCVFTYTVFIITGNIITLFMIRKEKPSLVLLM